MTKTATYFFLLLLLTVVIVMVSAAVGAAQLPLPAVVKSLLGGLPVVKNLVSGEAVPLSHHLIVWDVRLPRIMVALLVGASLGVAGAVFQGLLLNPLADPFTIGVSAGAAFGATVAMILRGILVGLPLLSSLGIVPCFAFVGALMSLLFVYAVARTEGSIMPESLILAGVIVASFLSALISFCKSIAGENLSSIVFWIMGSLSGRLWVHVTILLPYFVVCFVVMQANARHLNIIAMGDATAMQLGVDVQRVRRRLLLVASLLTAVAVSISGVIGFIGLVVPHINRLILGPNHRTLLPASALLGGVILILSDTLARTVAGANEIPVGVVTALLGAPFFCYIFKRKFKAH
ncbi:MAG: iron ABC transporter permease [Deltaproteobacteria bacterium]|nr:iron ABC transporter permease [Candidatus Anaeroferrophillus wilburensis]MBN2889474.1 iron ABC transporter permease [Deltaproteobacteria bacterium]